MSFSARLTAYTLATFTASLATSYAANMKAVLAYGGANCDVTVLDTRAGSVIVDTKARALTLEGAPTWRACAVPRERPSAPAQQAPGKHRCHGWAYITAACARSAGPRHALRAAHGERRPGRGRMQGGSHAARARGGLHTNTLRLSLARRSLAARACGARRAR